MLLNITNALITTRGSFHSIVRSAFIAAAVVVSAHAQYTPPPPPLTTGPCVPTKKDPCIPPASTTPPAASERFPFPGEPSASDKPASTSPASGDFPFPGEPESTAKAPAAPAKAFSIPGEPESSGSGSSSSSSSNSNNSSADDPAVDGTPASAAGARPTRAKRRLLPKVEDLDKRESEDIEVSKYYASTGNFLGSYLRAQDAVKTIPDDPMAHFALAQSALRLKKNDEAIAEYKLYLKLDPEGEKVKESRRALAELISK